MGDKVTDYYHVDIPHDLEPEEYSTYQRRSEVLDFVLSARSPKSVNRTQLADRYDVAVSTISRDIDRLGDAIAELFDERSMTLETRALREEIVTDLLEEDDWRAKQAAFGVHMDFLDYLGFDDVLVEDDADDDEIRTRGNIGGLSDSMREEMDRLHDKAKKETEPFLVEQNSGGTDGGG